MAARPVLADSSWYIDRLRAGLDPLKELAEIGQSRDIAICGVVRVEVGRGLRVERARGLFQAFWDVMVNVPTDNRLWEEVESMAWTLARQGHHPPLADLLIACSARRIGAVVLTLDDHFRHMPGVESTDRLI